MAWGKGCHTAYQVTALEIWLCLLIPEAWLFVGYVLLSRVQSCIKLLELPRLPVRWRAYGGAPFTLAKLCKCMCVTT